MIIANLYAAWIGVLLGLLSGIPLGLRFHDENWLGGYSSWKRRLLRLGHVSFFGISFLNFAFVATVPYMHVPEASLLWPSRLFIAALITMPTVCLLAAFNKPMRHLFVVPVLSVIGATGLFLFGFLQ
jgi:hypothetical protein